METRKEKIEKVMMERFGKDSFIYREHGGTYAWF